MSPIKIATILALGLLSAIACQSDKQPPNQKDVAQTVEIQFDIPQLLRQNITQVREKLGEPESEWTPNELQLKLYSDRIEYKQGSVDFRKGTTWIYIDYWLSSGEITSIFIQDKTEGRTKGELLILGNLDPGSNNYKLRIQGWVNPELARSHKASEIAGIEVTRL